MTRSLIAIAIGVGCVVSSVWAQSVEEELLHADREMAKAAAAGDLDTVFSYWADTAEIYSPGRPPAIGIDQIRKFVERRRALAGSSIAWEPMVAHVSASADLGYTRGRYEMTFPTPSGDPTDVRGTYVSIWTRDDANRWRCILEIHSPLPPVETGGQ